MSATIATRCGGGQRVLVVEDHVESATSMSRLLRLFGYRVRVANDGLAAVEAAERFVPFAAFIDLTLPKLDGFQVAERLRASPLTHDALLIAMTGWVTDEHAHHAQAAGFDRQLVKPISVDALVGALASHV
jgi:CheY-like chemotaxis protein